MLAYPVELIFHLQLSSRARPQNRLSGQRPFIASGDKFEAKPKYSSLKRLDVSTVSLLDIAGPCIDGGFIAMMKGTVRYSGLWFSMFEGCFRI